MIVGLNIIWIALGGFAGAIFRFGIGTYFKTHSNYPIPLGTFIVNIVGSFLLGWLLGHDIDGMWYSLLGIGFLGAFTTFSTLKVEFIQMVQKKANFHAVVYLLMTYFFGILAAFLGYLS
ncbi:fluoride efflux transporter CrcB [Bacillus sp. 31A1R]|uniref:Fluoride-specific ion channel FluC n=1 Tax=Robertmurraya mangrovi TaxID=3098077 RepID=A0ABU5J4Z8_9BACI|nr:fluoride efflux transporter CrcB [Bacillus sp. 31A1R]MDZ5474499.1 fluoride efflux transporter CrcB [Bacillus sp. 31A1R]